MKRRIFSSVMLLILAFTANAQNDTLYIMKAGVVIGKYNINTQVDSIIFYQPTTSTTNTVTDIDGNVYTTVTIGTQTWMAENLKTTKYIDGTAIPSVTDNTDWANLTSPGYCWYENDQATNGNTYGALYNWFAVGTGNLCPTDWHVPTDAEWTILTDYVGDQPGTKLKSTSGWFGNGNGSDEYGFSALPGGYRTYGGVFYDTEFTGDWWSSTQGDASYAWSRNLHYNYESVLRFNYDKKLGLSVRCLRDY